MLRVTVEKVPFGVEAGTHTLGTMDICNLSQYKNKADYSVQIFNDLGETENEFFVHGFNRENGFWGLLREALNTEKREGLKYG